MRLPDGFTAARLDDGAIGVGVIVSLHDPSLIVLRTDQRSGGLPRCLVRSGRTRPRVAGGVGAGVRIRSAGDKDGTADQRRARSSLGETYRGRGRALAHRIRGRPGRNQRGSTPSRPRVFRPSHEAQAWALCDDEAALAAKGLAPYSTTLQRTLWTGTPDGPFVGASDVERIQAELLGGRTDLLALNPQAGRLMIRRHALASWREAIDAINQRKEGATRTMPPALGRSSQQSGPTLLADRRGEPIRAVESLHLNLSLLAGALIEAKRTTQQLGRPMLNLTDESFRVAYRAGSALPVLWTARVDLVDAGDALQVADAFIPMSEAGPNPFRPAWRAGLSGTGEVRIRHADASELQGTLVAPEPISCSSNARIWMRLATGKRAIEITAHPIGESTSEVQFRAEADGAAELDGVTLAGTAFEVFETSSTPADLYAIAVLGMIGLLEQAGGLGQAVDELQALARRVRDEEGPLESRIAERVDGSLAPTASSIPEPVWHAVLAMLIRMMPGADRESHARDVGDARPGAIAEVYTPAIRDVERLLTRTQSLIVVDWRQNREIQEVIGHLT